MLSSLHMTPDDEMRMTLDKSSSPGCSSSHASMGAANAWPTITIELAFVRATSRHSSSAVKRRDGSVTIVPPIPMVMNDENWPVPCISGHAGSMTSGGRSGSIRDASSSTDVAGSMPTRALPPAPSTLKRSSWRHITPLGMPVVPPVYRSRRSSGERPQGPATRSAPGFTVVS